MDFQAIQTAVTGVTLVILIGRTVYGARKKDIEAVTEQLKILNGRVRATEVGLAAAAATATAANQAAATAATAAAAAAAAVVAAASRRRDT